MEHEDAVVFDHIGDIYLKLNRVPQALEAWQKAMKLDPKNKYLAEKIESAKTTISKASPAKTNPTQ
jgi:cytochrome c-type biogenesis protein CcmH/NrfG